MSFWKSLNNFGKAVFLVLLCIFIIFLTQVHADQVLRRSLDFVTTPILKVTSVASEYVLGTGKFLGGIGKISDENRLLKAQVAALELQDVTLEEFKLENQQLRDQLGLQQKQNFKLKTARVIGSEPVGNLKVLTINAGMQQGIAVKMPVVVSQGLLVGYVQEVYDTSARVMLLLDTSVEMPARIQQSRADGIVKGQPLGQGLSMSLIPQDATVERGNTVITSGLGSTMPPGLLIGYVQAVNKDTNQIFQTADILPAVDFGRLETVMVITNFNPSL